jgi:hypothetical protein
MDIDLVDAGDFLARLPAGFGTDWRLFDLATAFDVAFPEPVALFDFLPAFLLAFTLRTPVTAAVFLTFATSAPRLCNGRRVVSGSFRSGNLGAVVTYVNRSST